MPEYLRCSGKIPEDDLFHILENGELMKELCFIVFTEISYLNELENLKDFITFSI
jgi:hypothetical protein